MNTKLLALAGLAVAALAPWVSAAENANPATLPPWIKTYGNPQLDTLIVQSLAQNPDLEAALARQRSASAGIAIARSGWFPQLAGGASWMRGRDPSLGAETAETTTLGAQLSWEIDLAGRVRHLNRSARANAEATRATTDAIMLQLVADTATTYFAHQASMREVTVLEEGIALRERARKIISNRAKAGAATDLDVARADSELAAAQVDLAEVNRIQAQLRFALSTLVGTSALDAPVEALSQNTAIPEEAPPALPANLLLRRPDVFAAAQNFAATSALIGVARAEFFPRIDLLGSAGYVSADINNLTDWANRAWSLGPRIYLPLFQGGRNRARLAQAHADADTAEANYRCVVLQAVEEIATSLSNVDTLRNQAVAQAAQLKSARRAAALSLKRYEAGAAGYLEVIDAERTRLEAERKSVQLDATRLIAHIRLIKALGGDWQAASERSIVASR